MPAIRRTGEFANPSSDRLGLGRRAFTMVELVLVMVILVVVMALAVPAIQNTVNGQAIIKAADRVRVAMGQARVRAIRTGEVYAVFYQRGGQWFQVAPLADHAQITAAPLDSGSISAIERDYSENYLPRDVQFAAGEAIEDNRSQSSKQNSGNAAGTDAILFYPDGTSQDARLVLHNSQGRTATVELRGLTGVARSFRGDR